MNALLIEPQVARANELTAALAARGFFLRATSDPYFALTMAERAEIGVVFISAVQPQIPAAELVEILRRDPALSRLRIVVYDVGLTDFNEFPSKTQQITHSNDQELVGGMAATISALHEMQSGAFNSRGWANLNTAGVAMIGTFEVTTVPDLLQLVCSSGDQGVIVVRTPLGSGRVEFGPERVFSVRYRDLDLIEAMTLMMDDVEHHRTSQFRVTKTATENDSEEGIRPSGLLLEVAVALDDLRRTRVTGSLV